MTISEVSKKYNLTADTIRYYEKEGLIPTVPRDKNGIRDFDENSCGWIEFIKCMRSAGLEIETLKKYVSLFRQGTKTVKERKILLIEQREKLLKKQEDIKATLDRLNYKIEKYEEIEKGKLKDFAEKP
jgi:DNA-binding transcriptional MerR regulator